MTAPDLFMLERKAEAVLREWQTRYEAQQKKKAISSSREAVEQLVIEADFRRQQLRSILKATLTVNDKVEWSRLKFLESYKRRSYPDAAPKRLEIESVKPFQKPPPLRLEPPMRPMLRPIGFLDSILGRKRQIEAENKASQDLYQSRINEREAAHTIAVAAWESEKRAWEDVQEKSREQQRQVFEEASAKWLRVKEACDDEQDRKEKEHTDWQAKENAKVDALKEAWLKADPSAVMEHASLVLDASQYDAIIPKDYSVHYDAGQRLLVVDYRLPAPEALPSLKSARLVAASGEVKETHLIQKEMGALFDNLCYQICLRTIHELFEADEPGNINSIVFNGVCESLDRATGQLVTSTILSLRAERAEFLAINLAAVEPKDCFKRLKGVGASTLSGLTPVPPLVSMNRDDNRFIEGRAVDLGSDGGTNLAAIGWEDFEHLVRELFEKEFASRGGEVRVTQASSDGGVDAVAFDPDPISGGKIVIQAKRYTKTVGVAAVRDLYGTVLNEGANKGILVTTSDFGPDAHKFAADKPLTLMGGSHLLYLLEKHGQKARIDIKEARRDLGLR